MLLKGTSMPVPYGNAIFYHLAPCSLLCAPCYVFLVRSSANLLILNLWLQDLIWMFLGRNHPRMPLLLIFLLTNPEHLEVVTLRDNTVKLGKTGYSAVNFRKTHCPKGHEYTEENIYRRPGSTSRYCRKCAKINGYIQNHKRVFKKKKV